MRLMTGAGVPLPLVGLVHVANRITVHRPVDAAERARPVGARRRPAPARPGPAVRRGAIATVDGDEVWRGVSTYLRRGRGVGPAGGRRASEDATAPPGLGDLAGAGPGGRRLRRGCPATATRSTPRGSGARLFGFPRPIAHGMWSKARCLAALEGRLPDAYTVEVAFKLPILLPGTVAFAARRAGPSPCTTRSAARHTSPAPCS